MNYNEMCIGGHNLIIGKEGNKYYYHSLVFVTHRIRFPHVRIKFRITFRLCSAHCGVSSEQGRVIAQQLIKALFPRTHPKSHRRDLDWYLYRRYLHE